MLITMPIFCDSVNERYDLVRWSINSLLDKTELGKHRLLLIDNNSPDSRITEFLRSVKQKHVGILLMRDNYYNNGAFNVGLQQAMPGEVFCTVESDVIFYDEGWADFLETTVKQTPYDGVALGPQNGVYQSVWSVNREYGYEIHTLDEYGEVELFPTTEVWNGCTAWMPNVRKQIGYFRPPRTGYGYNDALYSQRVRLAHLLMAVNWDYYHIQHIDPFHNSQHPYRVWKRAEAKLGANLWAQMKQQYDAGERPIYEDPFPENMEYETL